MSVFFQIGQACAGPVKQAAEKLAAGKFFRFDGGRAVEANPSGPDPYTAGLTPGGGQRMQQGGGSRRPSLASMVAGDMGEPKYKFNPATGKVDLTANYGLHPLYQQKLDQLKQQNKMFADLDPGFAEILGLAKPGGGAPAPTAGAAPQAPAAPSGGAAPQAVSKAFGSLPMNNYSKVPNVPLPSVH